jgi:two-component system LytT family response regulator
VNVMRIDEIQPWFNGEYIVVLRDGTKVQSSRGYRARLEALMT